MFPDFMQLLQIQVYVFKFMQILQLPFQADFMQNLNPLKT